MTIGFGFNIRFDRCYKCNKQLGFFESMCSSCGTDNSGLKFFQYLVYIGLLAALFLFGMALLPGFMMMLIDFKILPSSLTNLTRELGRFVVTQPDLLFEYLAICFGAILVLATIASFYRDRLRKNIQDQVVPETAPEKSIQVITGMPPVKDASLDVMAKAFFTPGQYKIFRFVAIAFIVSMILPFLSGSIIPFIPTEDNYFGWNMFLIFLTAAFGFMAPVLFVAMIALFIFFLYKNMKLYSAKYKADQDKIKK